MICQKLIDFPMSLKTLLQLLTMIKNIFINPHIRKFIIFPLKQASRNFYFSTLSIFRESDVISQDDIDSILGNQIKPKDVAKNESSKSQLTQRQLFYGLVPMLNDNFPICIDPDFVELLETPNQNIMQTLKITVQSSFKDYCTNIQEFWREDQLYGDVCAPTKIQAKSIEFKELLTADSKYLEKLRGQFVVNLSIPGSIEAEDSRNFLEMRPVEEFRNTPIIPISESAMKKHKQKLAEYHRKQMVLELSKESIFSFFLFVTAAGVCGYMIYLILQKEEERTVAYTRLKYNRRMGIQEAPTFKL